MRSLDTIQERTVMVQDEQKRSRERVRMLAEIVSVQVDEDRLDALATSFDAALAMLDGIDGPTGSDQLSVAEPYDAAWHKGSIRT
jgi:hypothetical protein